MAQDFFAAFGHDGLGQIGSETTINSGDMAGILMIAVQALEKRTAKLKQNEAQIAVLQSEVKDLKAKQAYFETVAARLEAVELLKKPSIQITADVMP
jgi:galactokinase